MGLLPVSMAIFNSYIKLPEGNRGYTTMLINMVNRGYMQLWYTMVDYGYTTMVTYDMVVQWSTMVVQLWFPMGNYD